MFRENPCLLLKDGWKLERGHFNIEVFSEKLNPFLLFPDKSFLFLPGKSLLPFPEKSLLPLPDKRLLPSPDRRLLLVPDMSLDDPIDSEAEYD